MFMQRSFRQNHFCTNLTIAGKTRTREKYRTVYNELQKVRLESEYAANTYISADRKASIAQATKLTERQVKIWFQNRRAKDRKLKYRSVTSTSSSPANY
jgi:homeobox protein CDX